MPPTSISLVLKLEYSFIVISFVLNDEFIVANFSKEMKLCELKFDLFNIHGITHDDVILLF